MSVNCCSGSRWNDYPGVSERGEWIDENEVEGKVSGQDCCAFSNSIYPVVDHVKAFARSRSDVNASRLRLGRVEVNSLSHTAVRYCPAAMTDSLPPIDHLVRKSAKRAHAVFSAEQAFSISNADDANERRCVPSLRGAWNEADNLERTAQSSAWRPRSRQSTATPRCCLPPSSPSRREQRVPHGQRARRLLPARRG